MADWWQLPSHIHFHKSIDFKTNELELYLLDGQKYLSDGCGMWMCCSNCWFPATPRGQPKTEIIKMVFDVGCGFWLSSNTSINFIFFSSIFFFYILAPKECWLGWQNRSTRIESENLCQIPFPASHLSVYILQGYAIFFRLYSKHISMETSAALVIWAEGGGTCLYAQDSSIKMP